MGLQGTDFHFGGHTAYQLKNHINGYDNNGNYTAGMYCVDSSSREWENLGTKFDHIGEYVENAMKRAAAAHEGVAADAARGAVSPLAPFAKQAADQARGVQQAVDEQTTAQQQARHAMPEDAPQNPPEKAPMWDWFGLGSYEEDKSQYDAKNKQAQRAMESYQRSSNSNLADVPPFQQPPKPAFAPAQVGGGADVNGVVDAQGSTSAQGISSHLYTGTKSAFAGDLGGAGAPTSSLGGGGTTAPQLSGGAQAAGTTPGWPGGSPVSQRGWQQGGTAGVTGAAVPGSGGRSGGVSARGGAGGGAARGLGSSAGRGGAGARSLGSGGSSGTGSPAGQAASAGAGSSAAGRGGNNGMTGMPRGGGARQGQDDEEHQRAEYLVETEDVFGGDPQQAAPPVLGENR